MAIALDGKGKSSPSLSATHGLLPKLQEKVEQ
jgi:hypothetical protein